MKQYRLCESGDRGWFIGAFDRAVLKTDQFEVSYQFNPAGDISVAHYHKIAREINLIASGKCLINRVLLTSGDIVEIDPMEVLEAKYLEDTFTVCVKLPSVLGDKYLI